MEKLLVGMPLYGSVSVAFFDRWISLDKTAVASVTTVKGAYIGLSMQLLTQQALKVPGWDRLVVLEHDMVPPIDALTRIARLHEGKDVVGCVYFTHAPPHFPNVCVETSAGKYNPASIETIRAWCDQPGLHECNSVGMGLTSISRKVLESWDPSVPMWDVPPSFPDYPCHDIWFCRAAREQGFKIWADSGLIVDHLTLVPVGLVHALDHAKI